jgi:hypothetical protein
MHEERRGALRRRLGPIGMSLVASALTAAGFAAFSIADSGTGTGSTGSPSGSVQTLPAPPGAPGGSVMVGPRLSAADRQKMEEFQQCMQDNGAPGPPRFDSRSGPPKPPSAADQQQIQKAYEACKEKLPQALQNAGPPRVGIAPCGPPPGVPGQKQGGTNQNQSNQSGTQSSGSSS